jgi:hypothetical protein
MNDQLTSFIGDTPFFESAISSAGESNFGIAGPFVVHSLLAKTVSTI